MKVKSFFKLISAFFILISIQDLNATHIVGGEITYRNLGNYNYELTLKIYRDCHHGQAPYDNPTTITIYNSAGTVVNYLNITFPGSRSLPLVSIDPCLRPPDDVCVEEAIFIDTINLPPIPGGYQLVYQRCCRNETILNIIDPLGTGATYYTVIPDTSVVPMNSTPKFNNFPPIFICNDEDLVFDHSATDPDGDSLVYRLCPAYQGADPFLPYPVPPHAPPYALVNYAPGYNAFDPLAHDPTKGKPLTIDSITGLLTARPNTIGQFVVGVCVYEYRDSVLLTVNKRDFQFNVTDCPPIATASLPTSIKECGYTINFENLSLNAMSYDWDFGDPTTTSDISNLMSPTYTYPDTGQYTVTLIINKGFLCADTATSTVHIYNTIDGANFSASRVCEGNANQFQDQSILTEGPEVSRFWDFGDGKIDTTKNPMHLYANAGGYNAMLIVYNKNGCTDTLRKVIIVDPLPLVDAGKDTLICSYTKVQLQASGGNNYQWNNTPELSCTSCSSPIASPKKSVYYSVTGFNNFGCRKKDSIHVMLIPVDLPDIYFSHTGGCYSDPVKFNGGVNNFNYDCFKQIQWQWYFGDGGKSSEQNPTHIFQGVGPYQVSLSVIGDTSINHKENITLLPLDSCLKNAFVPNAFTPNGDNNNDVLYLRGINTKKIIFRIYNRWGEEVYRTYNIHEGWDGTYKGEKLTPQVFEYMAEVTYYDDSEVLIKGNVTLLE